MISVNGLNECGNSICIFIRHGEKDVIRYCLTEKGKRESITLGKQLILLGKKVKIYSSPEKRCVETANIINSMFNREEGSVHYSAFLGKPGIQVKDEGYYACLTNSMKCRDIFKEWKKGMHLNAMNSLEIIKKKTLSFFENTASLDGITLYISQSGTVACTGYALGLIDFSADSDDWVDFLDGYIWVF